MKKRRNKHDHFGLSIFEDCVSNDISVEEAIKSLDQAAKSLHKRLKSGHNIRNNASLDRILKS
jgi:20S proteasome alpha/beta subunit